MPTIEQAIKHHNLNTEQRRAFIFLACAFLSHVLEISRIENAALVQQVLASLGPLANYMRTKPLRMYLGGQGGCGKSHLLHAFKDFTRLWGLPNSVLLTATTGTAAVNIKGVTIHSVVNLMAKGTGPVSLRAASDKEVKSLTGVAMIIIDECSMLGLAQLHDLNARLNIIRLMINPSLEGPQSMFFGSLHIVLVGDFMQLTPVGATTLYSLPPTPVGMSSMSTRATHEALARHIFKDIIDVVVVLEVPVRQQGDQHFAGILARLRACTTTAADIDAINSRALPRNKDPLPASTPIIVYRNELRLKINDELAAAVARANTTKVFRIEGKFTAKRKDQVLSDAHIRLLVRAKSLGESKVQGTIDVYVGMPVMVVANVAVTGYGIANGTTATVLDVIYPASSSQEVITLANGETITRSTDGSQPVAVLLLIKDPHFKQIVGLPPCVFPLFARGPLECTIENRATKQKMQAKFTQFPLVPAFCLTGHKVQGQTMSSILIAEPNNPHARLSWLYTVLSRVTSLNGLFLTEPIKSI